MRNKRDDKIFEKLGNKYERVHLKIKERSFKLVWKNDAGSYFLNILEFMSLALEKQNKQRN